MFMIDAIMVLFLWLPAGLRELVAAALVFFLLFALFRFIKAILDMIPFV